MENREYNTNNNNSRKRRILPDFIQNLCPASKKRRLNQTDKKVWELIRESVPSETHFGEAAISEKHNNFFVNRGNAKYEDMKKLIDHVKGKVMSKTGVRLDLEIILVE